MTSRRLTGKNTRTSALAAWSRTALYSKANREYRRFTLLNCLKTFRNGFITIPKRQRNSEFSNSNHPSLLQDVQKRAASQTTEQRENEEAIKQHHALIGMTAAQVRQAWGEPKRVIRTMDERHTYEEWIYGGSSSTASLYFVDGIFKSGTRDDGR